MELLRTRDVEIPLRTACEVLGMPRATARRHLGPRYYGPRRPRPTSHRKLAQSEEQAMLAVLHSERFQDQAPRQVYAELLDEGKYVGSPSTMYRILAAHGESNDRRNQRQARSHAVPRLEATAPNRVWSWDISKLATYVPGVFLNLYLVLDLFSRYPVAWMIAERENSALSKQLFAQAISRYKLEPGTITVHNDRGAPMTASGFVDMLAQLGVERSKSRPRVSNDNPFSESCFKTTKYQRTSPTTPVASRAFQTPVAGSSTSSTGTPTVIATPGSRCSRPPMCSSDVSPSSQVIDSVPSTPPTLRTPSASSADGPPCACRPPRSQSIPSTQAPPRRPSSKRFTRRPPHHHRRRAHHRSRRCRPQRSPAARCPPTCCSQRTAHRFHEVRGSTALTRSAITVSGLTSISAVRHLGHSLESATQNARSTRVSFGRLGRRSSTASCWRRARFSSASAPRDRRLDRAVASVFSGGFKLIQSRRPGRSTCR
jgi:transposase InsO family protein